VIDLESDNICTFQIIFRRQHKEEAIFDDFALGYSNSRKTSVKLGDTQPKPSSTKWELVIVARPDFTAIFALSYSVIRRG
jgi:hypothetical protein